MQKTGEPKKHFSLHTPAKYHKKDGYPKEPWQMFKFLRFLCPPDEASRHLTVSPEQWEASNQFWAFSCDVLRRGHACFGDIWGRPRDRALMMGCSCCAEKDPGPGRVMRWQKVMSRGHLVPLIFAFLQLSFFLKIKDWKEIPLQLLNMLLDKFTQEKATILYLYVTVHIKID